MACLSLLAAFVLAIIKLVNLSDASNTKDPDFTFALIIIINTGTGIKEHHNSYCSAIIYNCVTSKVFR